MLSAAQKTKVFIVRVGVFVLWWVDVFSSCVTGHLGLFFSMFVTSFTLFFLVTVGQTGYLSKAIEGYLISSGVLEMRASTPSHSVVSTLPKLVKKIPLPAVSAQSVYIGERNTQKKLYALNYSNKLAPASTTKLMTALVSVDMYKPEDVLQVPPYCPDVEGTKAYFPAGLKFTFDMLIHSVLIGSAGDSVCVLENSKIPRADFIGRMNWKARELGMKSTHFSNGIGLDESDGSHYSTAEDLYKLADAALKNNYLSKIVGTKEHTLISQGNHYIYTYANTNRLLWEIPGTTGVKTGTTPGAGEVLIYEYKDNGKDILIVVMGSQNRFEDTSALLTWVLQSYSWEN